MPNSRPIPDCLRPPNGREKSSMYPLTPKVPDLDLFCERQARSRSGVKTAPDRP